jgi:hypothetical protein
LENIVFISPDVPEAPEAPEAPGEEDSPADEPPGMPPELEVKFLGEDIGSKKYVKEDPGLREPSEESKKGSQFKPSFRHSASLMKVNRLWQFCFYNIPSDEIQSNEDFTSIKEEYKKFLSKPADKRNVEQFVKRVKCFYKSIYGNNNKKINNTSLVAYSGPVKHREGNAKWVYHGPIIVLKNNCIRKCDLLLSYCISCNEGPGLLYFGDINLKAEENREKITEFLEKHIFLEDIQIIQVPHHGSEDNWVSNYKNTLSHTWSVFTAGRFNKSHPSEKVVEDLSDRYPIFVDEYQGVFWYGHVCL